MAVDVQRPHRGARVSAFYPVKAVPPLSSLNSAFHLQEYISLLIRLDVHDVDTIVALPDKPSTEDAFAQDGNVDEAPVDRACWIYEQLRRLAQDLSHPLITALQQECTRSSCPQMKAGEWLYLCVAHANDGAPEQCCAIDYILHTLDSATALLNSPRAFPSRISIPQTSHHHFSSLARRLGRIFAHAYFHHKEAFQQAEAESSLYARFLKLSRLFGLVPAEFLVIPESAIHSQNTDEDVEPPRLLAAAVHPQVDSPKNQPTVELERRGPTNTHDPLHIANVMDSPRRPGRNRTDTMVFSEGYNIAEELAQTEAREDLVDSPVDALTVQAESSQSIDSEITVEETDCHVNDELISSESGSPTEGPFISVEEPASQTELPATTLSSAPAFSPPDVSEETLLAVAPVVVMTTVKEEEAADRNTKEDAEDQSVQQPAPDFQPADDVGGHGDEEHVPESDAATSAEPAVVAQEVPCTTEEFTLDLSEPPPSEPIPPESDITSEDPDGDGDGDGAEHEPSDAEKPKETTS